MRSGRALALASILVFAACGNGSSDDGFVGPNDGGTPDGGVEGGGGECGTLPDGGAMCGLTNAAKVVSVDGLKSASHPKAQATESATITFDTKTNVNEVLLPPTVIGGKSAGFPVEFTIAWNDGTTWQDALSFTHMAAAADGSCAKLSLPDGVDATAIKLTATVLGADGASYDLSLDGIAATHDTALDPVDAKLASATSSSVSDPATDWAAAHAIDGNPATVFGSAVHGSASSAESLTVTFADATVDHVTITPRYAASGAALGFPTSFSLTAIEGTTETPVASYASFPTPHRGDSVVLAFPSPVKASSLRIDASALGQDDVGNFVFQLADVAVGSDPGFAALRWASNDASSGRMAVTNVGSEDVDRPEQIGHWDYDLRDVVLAPQTGTLENIYAPSIVSAGGTSWDVFFGGWDGSTTGNDRVYRTTTSDDFGSFSAHSLVIDHGAFVHTNNDSTIEAGPNDWRMMLTAYDGSTNKPMAATSSDGVTWSPSSGTSSALITMSGYPNWASADVNGGNVIVKDPSGLWHLYFIDFQNFTGVFHATSSDFKAFTYQGVYLAEQKVMNDLKSFSYGGSTWNVGAYHFNGQHVWLTVSESLATAPASTVAFDNAGTADDYIVAVGLVQDGKRLHGALYGAGAVSSLDHNRIFAEWLQKKVIFTNTAVRWGDVERAKGPDEVDVLTAEAASVETGRFEIYDTDGVRLLYRSPKVTMRSGDVFRYAPGH